MAFHEQNLKSSPTARQQRPWYLWSCLYRLFQFFTKFSHVQYPGLIYSPCLRREAETNGAKSDTAHGMENGQGSAAEPGASRNGTAPAQSSALTLLPYTSFPNCDPIKEYHRCHLKYNMKGSHYINLPKINIGYGLFFFLKKEHMHLTLQIFPTRIWKGVSFKIPSYQMNEKISSGYFSLFYSWK